MAAFALAALGMVRSTPVFSQDAPFAGSTDGAPQLRMSLNLRPRYNQIDESDKAERTQGWTVRAVGALDLRLSASLKLRIEGIHTDHLGAKRFNDDVGRIASSEYPLLPDPRTTDLNQAYVEWSGPLETRLRAGRQFVQLDNDRMLSNNDFRQIPTVFTGVMLTNNWLPDTEFRVGGFDRVRGALGTNQSSKLTLADIAYNFTPEHNLSAYGYWLDQASTGNFTGLANNSHRVLGVRAEGGFPLAGGWSWRYLADLARQDAYAGGNAAIDAGYRRIGVGVSQPALEIRADRELRTSPRGNYAFQTPYTDLYAYNGWTLQFITAPRTGLRDDWLTLRAEWGAWSLFGEFHRFQSDAGSVDLARERDLSVRYDFWPNAFARLQHARFTPERGLVGGKEVRKTWLTFNFSY